MPTLFNSNSKGITARSLLILGSIGSVLAIVNSIYFLYFGSYKLNNNWFWLYSGCSIGSTANIFVLIRSFLATIALITLIVLTT